MIPLEQDLAPYRIGDTATLEIAQKYIKNTIFGILGYFCPIFLVGVFSYSAGGQVFRKIPHLPSPKSRRHPI